MNILEIRKEQRLTVDLHGCDARELYRQLDYLLSTASDEIQEIELIHGCHHGNMLQRIIRHEYSNQRIQRMIIGCNQGRTSYILKV